jgi:lipopolysaccharide/colanic/teichoic acid biosynthesis glycosyltransferase
VNKTVIHRLSHTAQSGRTPLVLRLRFQLLGSLFFSILLPAILQFLTLQRLPLTTGSTLIAALLALLAGFYTLKRLTVYPGIRSSFYIVPIFSAVYALVLAIWLFLRLDYSRFFLGISFVSTIGWFYFLYFLTLKYQRQLFAIVPQGNAQSISTLKGMDWAILTDMQDKVSELPTRCNAVIADFNSDLSKDWQRFLAQCALHGVPVFDYRQIRESLTGKVRIEHISENTLGTLVPNIVYMKLKVLMDVTLAIIAAIFTIPLIVIVALFIKTTSTGPVLFRQMRIGYRGKPFVCYKFRTMITQRAPEEDEPLANLEAAKTKKNDPRITRLGAFMRKSRIDELPQIINILKGEMSWIGPRPEAVVLANWYEDKLPFYSYRHVVRPGISGWAQVNQGHVVDLEDIDLKLQYDFYYIKNFSPWLDVIILFRTLRTVFTGYGAK